MSDPSNSPRASEPGGGPIASGSPVETKADLGFGKGGVPWPLMLFYLAFLVFFVWYVLEYQLPDYLGQGPASLGEGSNATPR